MINKTILKNKGFTQKEINLITKHFKHLCNLYVQNEYNMFKFLEYINEIQNEIFISFVNNWILNFKLLKTNKNINVDLLNSSL
jgi:hypothetical protein